MRDLPRHQATENPDLFLLYEHYVNQAALEAHRNTPHFKEIIEGSIVAPRHAAARVLSVGPRVTGTTQKLVSFTLRSPDGSQVRTGALDAAQCCGGPDCQALG